MTGSEQERRRAARIPERVQVRVKDIGGEGALANSIRAETLNMSASGLCLSSPEALMPETHLAMELTLEGIDDPVMAIGRVVWCDPDDDRYRVGVCFSWLRDEDRAPLQVIADYVAART